MQHHIINGKIAILIKHSHTILIFLLIFNSIKHFGCVGFLVYFRLLVLKFHFLTVLCINITDLLQHCSHLRRQKCFKACRVVIPVWTSWRWEMKDLVTRRFWQPLRGHLVVWGIVFTPFLPDLAWDPFVFSLTEVYTGY